MAAPRLIERLEKLAAPALLCTLARLVRMVDQRTPSAESPMRSAALNPAPLLFSIYASAGSCL
jgi:hypothetical protein